MEMCGTHEENSCVPSFTLPLGSSVLSDLTRMSPRRSSLTTDVASESLTTGSSVCVRVTLNRSDQSLGIKYN